ncbi:MAG: transporter ATP-binding protein [Verrucomicrobiales bacterium]|nr:transporter ATP-binding protein [Verrucomicrobiales bacterium]
MAKVTIQDLSKVFPVAGAKPIEAVKNLSITVEDKELLVLVGPSGCGKTTTLRLIAGLEEATRGTISLDGEVLNKIPPQDRDVAMVFQSHALYPQLTVFENMAVGLKLRKVPAKEIDQAVQEAAELLDLSPCLKMRPEQLSGGQRQRVALGRAIVRRPRLFLLDEPLSSLDAPLRVQMRAEIVQLQRNLGVTMILVTHDQTDAMSVGQRIAVMRAGELQQVARPREIYRTPVNRFVAGFIGFPAMQFLPGIIKQAREKLWFEMKTSEGKTLSLPIEQARSASFQKRVNQETILGLRPEHLSIVRSPETAPATLAAVVEWCEYLGAETILHVKIGEWPARLRLLNSQAVAFTPGDRLEIAVDMAEASYFDPENGSALV